MGSAEQEHINKLKKKKECQRWILLDKLQTHSPWHILTSRLKTALICRRVGLKAARRPACVQTISGSEVRLARIERVLTPSGAWHAAALWPLLIMSMTHEVLARTFRQTGPWPPKTIRGDCRDLYKRTTLEPGIENNECGRGHYLRWRRVRLCVRCCQRAIGQQIRSMWCAASMFCRRKKVALTAHTVLFWCQSVTSCSILQAHVGKFDSGPCIWFLRFQISLNFKFSPTWLMSARPWQEGGFAVRAGKLWRCLKIWTKTFESYMWASKSSFFSGSRLSLPLFCHPVSNSISCDAPSCVKVTNSVASASV